MKGSHFGQEFDLICDVSFPLLSIVGPIINFWNTLIWSDSYKYFAYWY